MKMDVALVQQLLSRLNCLTCQQGQKPSGNLMRPYKA
jgi:hypothetical protein